MMSALRAGAMLTATLILLVACASPTAEVSAPALSPPATDTSDSAATVAGQAGTSEADARFAEVRDSYFVESLRRYPVTATYLGADGYRPEFDGLDGQLRDYGAAARQAEVAAYRDLQTQLQAIPIEGLNPDNQVDYKVVGSHLGFLLHQLEDRRYYERAVDTYVGEPFRGVDWQLQGMTDTGDGLKGTEAEWDKVIRRLEAVPAFLATAKDNLTAGVSAGNLPDRRMAQRDGIDSCQSNEEYFRTTLPEQAKEYMGDQAFAAAKLTSLQAAATAAADAYADFATFVGDTYDLQETEDRYAVGDDEYNWRVKNVFGDDRDAATLYEYGADEVAKWEESFFAVAQIVADENGLDLAWSTDDEKRASTLAVFDFLSNDAPKSDDELLQFYRDAADRAVAYGREQELFDVPADYQLEIVETPPALRSSLAAAYYPAPPFKETGVGRFYLTPTGDDPEQLKLNNRASVTDTAVHEGFPGHDWHYKYMTQVKDQISDVRWLTPGAVEDSSAMWSDSMAVEGWALYSEELMAEPDEGTEYGFYTSAERLYELQGMLFRAARVRIDTGLHTGRMTYDEAVDYLATHRYMYPGACAKAETDEEAKAICGSSEREVFRYSKWPTQAIAYNLGMHEILDLREAYKAEMGDAYDPKAFHERYMSMGTIPPAYFGEVLLSGAVPPDATTPVPTDSD